MVADGIMRGRIQWRMKKGGNKITPNPEDLLFTKKVQNKSSGGHRGHTAMHSKGLWWRQRWYGGGRDGMVVAEYPDDFTEAWKCAYLNWLVENSRVLT